MRKSILRWGIDACFLTAMSWGFGWLFLIVTGTLLLLDRLPIPEPTPANSDIFYLGIFFVFPSLIGLIMSAIFTFISLKFHPSIGIYIIVCALLVILPTFPYMKSSFIPRLERSDELQCLYIFYIALGILLSNFIYQRIKLISNATSSPS